MRRSPIQLAVESVFLLLHFVVLVVILRGIRQKKASFAGSFYRLYVVQSSADCVNYVFTALIFYRLAPEVLLYSYWINIHYLICMWSANLQLLMHPTISLNRFTAICRPAIHAQVWNGRHTLFMIATAITVSMLSSLMLLFAPIKYNGPDGQVAVSILSPSMNSGRHMIALIITVFSTVVSFVLDLSAFVTFRRLDLWRKMQLDEDYRLLLFACVHFVAQLFYAAFLVCGLFEPFIPQVVGPLMRSLQYIVDAQSFSGPIALLSTSKPLRQEMLRQIRRSRGSSVADVVTVRQSTS